MRGFGDQVAVSVKFGPIVRSAWKEEPEFGVKEGNSKGGLA
jgi:hypothetical protein